MLHNKIKKFQPNHGYNMTENCILLFSMIKKKMLDYSRIMRLKDRSFLAIWCHGAGCSSHKNRYHSRCSEFNGSCLVLVDLLVSECGIPTLWQIPMGDIGTMGWHTVQIRLKFRWSP